MPVPIHANDRRDERRGKLGTGSYACASQNDYRPVVRDMQLVLPSSGNRGIRQARKHSLPPLYARIRMRDLRGPPERLSGFFLPVDVRPGSARRVGAGAVELDDLPARTTNDRPCRPGASGRLEGRTLCIGLDRHGYKSRHIGRLRHRFCRRRDREDSSGLSAGRVRYRSRQDRSRPVVRTRPDRLRRNVPAAGCRDRSLRERVHP